MKLCLSVYFVADETFNLFVIVCYLGVLCNVRKPNCRLEESF